MRRRSGPVAAGCPDRSADVVALLEAMCAGRAPVDAASVLAMAKTGCCDACAKTSGVLWRWELLNDHRADAVPVRRALHAAQWRPHESRGPDVGF